MSGIGDSLTVAAYRAGWEIVQRLPEPAAYALFDRLADVTHVRNGRDVRRLRENYRIVRPELDDRALESLVRDGVRSALRYYCEAFRLPVLGPDGLLERVEVHGDGPIRDTLAAGGSVICFLGHLGNWDLAGAWGTVHLGPVTTVAERLEPEQMYAEFLAFRESLGMTIYPLTGGGNVFARLREHARRAEIIPLLADRDLTAKGVGVGFCGHRTRMAAGPAALALVENRPLHPVSIRHERRGGRWGGWRIVITFHEAVPVPAAGPTRERITEMTQSCADVLGKTVREHTADWHMMQRFFTDDGGAA